MSRFRSVRGLLYSTSLALAGWELSGGAALAACVPTPTNQADAITCADAPDNQSVPPRTLQNGADTINLNSGILNGSISGGQGPDTFNLNGATLNGTLFGGEASTDLPTDPGTQPILVDTFNLTAGTINAPAGGGVVGDAVVGERGGEVVVIGGTVVINGNVSGSQGPDEITMDGGTVNGSISGEGTTISPGRGPSDDDQINLSGGTVSGTVSGNLGNDTINLSGTVVGGAVSGNEGNDLITWSAGTVGGINGNDGNDLTTFRNLTPLIPGPGPIIDGGLGSDRLVWDNTRGGGVERYVNWESFQLTNLSQLTFSGTLTLGDTGTGAGVLSIDPTSTISAGNGDHRIVPFTSGRLVAVTNSGTIDLTNGPEAATDSLTVVGSYVGQGGHLRLHTYLGGDTSPSDKLVISGTGASARGATSLGIVNVGGPGALTLGDGILVVEAISGATTESGAFGLSGIVAAGPYEYLLYRGGYSAGTEDNFYLRNAVLPPPDPDPGPDPDPEPAPPGPDPQPPIPDPDPSPDPTPPTPTPPNPAPGPSPAPSPQPITFFRPEAVVYAAVPAVARQVGLDTLGTFHERRGDQDLLTGSGALPAMWGRAFGARTEFRRNGPLAPEVDGHVVGFQAGLDLFGWEGDGHRDRIGVFVGHASADADIRGFAIGQARARGGSIPLDATSLGLSWTHVGPQGWYVDAIVMQSWLDGDPHSTRGIGISSDGTGTLASIEGGYPLPLMPGLWLEPQAQLVWQHVDLDTTRDLISTVAFDPDNAVSGRIGARLKGSFVVGSATLEPYLKANLWHTFAGTDATRFATVSLPTRFESTSFEIGGGLAARVTDQVSLYAAASYETDLGGDHRETIKGNLGLQVTW